MRHVSCDWFNNGDRGPQERSSGFLSCAAYTAAPVILKMSIRDATTMSTHLACASDDDDEQFVFILN